MDLYKIKNNKLNYVDKKSFNLEKDIQSIVENNFDTLFNLEFITTEFTVGNFRLDSLCYDNESDSFVIIEYKKGSSYSVIDQGYSYLSIMLNNKSDFILEYIEKTGKNLKKDDIDWSQSRIIFISPSFNSYQKNSINFQDVPFELWEIKRFSNDLISLNQILSSSSDSIKKFSNTKNSVIKSVTKEVKVYTEEDHLKKGDTKLQKLYYKIKERMSDWDDVDFKPMKKHIGIWRHKQMFSYFNIMKNSIKINIVKGYTGNKKEPFTLKDPSKVFHIFSNKWKELYQYDIKDDKDIDYVLMMVKQKYDSLD